MFNYNKRKMFNSLKLYQIRNNFLIKRTLHKYGLISNILDHPNENSSTIIKGWVKNIRAQKEIVFADVSDGSTSKKFQVVIPKALKPNNMTYGCSVEIKGTLTKNPRGQQELCAESIDVISECNLAQGYPFNPRTAHPPDYLRQYLHLRSRTNYISAILRLRSALTMLIHKFFESHHFIHVHTPVLTCNDCEGAGEVFKVQPENEDTLRKMLRDGLKPDTAYFGKKTFLTVSGQLHLEAICRGMGNVYTLGPTFRAENSRSRLHLTEFYMLEAELAFCDSLEELQNTIAELIKYLAMKLLENNSADLSMLNKEYKIGNWINKEFITLKYDEAKAILQKKAIDTQGEGLTKEEELALVEHCNGLPVFVINWPKKLKSFYMKECKGDTTKVEALDLLFPVTGEVVGGSLREDNLSLLEAKLPSTQLQWYLDLRKFGNIPTGGFGLGLERLLQTLCGIPNIKDTIAFPRWPHNCDM